MLQQSSVGNRWDRRLGSNDDLPSGVELSWPCLFPGEDPTDLDDGFDVQSAEVYEWRRLINCKGIDGQMEERRECWVVEQEEGSQSQSLRPQGRQKQSRSTIEEKVEFHFFTNACGQNPHVDKGWPCFEVAQTVEFILKTKRSKEVLSFSQGLWPLHWRMLRFERADRRVNPKRTTPKFFQERLPIPPPDEREIY